MTRHLTAGFDYGSLDDETASKLKYFATSGKALVRKSMIRFIADFGELLSDARKLLAQHGNGTFCKWAEAEFDLSRKTIYNYVNAWERCLCKGHDKFGNVTPTAIYLLAHDDTPDDVVSKVVKLASKREAVTKADVETVIAKGRQPNLNIVQCDDEDEVCVTVTQTFEGEAEDDEEETSDVDAGTADEPVDYGKCPACAGTKWTDDVFGAVCAKCGHVHGEPAGDPDDDQITTQRQKTVKTVEALIRAIDDLHLLLPRPNLHEDAIATVKEVLAVVRGWK